MTLKYVFIINSPYNAFSVIDELGKSSIAHDYGWIINPKDKGDLQNQLSMLGGGGLGKDTKVLILGDQQLETGFGAAAIVETLSSATIGQNISWAGTTYINYSSQALVDRVKQSGVPGPVILRKSNNSLETSVLGGNELPWLHAVSAIPEDTGFFETGMRDTASLLAAATNMHGPLTIVQKGLSPLVFDAPTSTADDVKAKVAEYLSQEEKRFPGDPDERLLNLGAALQRLTQPGHIYKASLFASIDAGAQSLRAFIAEKGEAMIQPYINRPEGRETPLSRAAATGDLESVVVLLNLGAHPVPPDSSVSSALEAAISAGHTHVVQYLLTLSDTVISALLFMPGAKGVLPISLAAAKSEEILKVILNHSPNARGTLDKQSGPNNNTALIDAALEGSAGSVQELLSRGANQTIAGKDGRTALSFAVFQNRVDVVNVFLDGDFTGAINAQDRDGNTALHLAAYRGHTDLVNALLVKGALPLIENKAGNVPLFAAVEAGKLEAVKVLMSNSMAVARPRSTDGRTVLHQAALGGRVEIIQALIGKGANVNAITKANETPLMLAVIGNSKAAFDELMKKGADLNAKNARGQTVLDLAVAILGDRGKEDARDAMIRELMQKSAPISSSQKADAVGASFDVNKVFFYPTKAGDDATKIKSGAIFQDSAIVRGGVTIGKGAYIGSRADIGVGATIGEGAQLDENVTIGVMAKIGDGAKVHANVHIADGLKVRDKQEIAANRWVDGKGIYFLDSDGNKGVLEWGSGSKDYAKRIRAAVGPMDLPGSNLRDQDPDASAGAIAGGERRPGELIDEDAEVHSDDAQVGQAGWKKVLAQLTAYRVVGSEDSPPALTADEYRARIEQNLAGALDAVFASEHLDFVARVPLVAQGVSHFKQYLLPSIDKALSALDAAAPGGVIGLDALSAKLGEQSVDKHIQDSLAALEATDPKSSLRRDQARRQTDIVFKELAGDLHHQVTVRRMLVADAGLHSFWSQLETHLGSGGRAATRNRFMQLTVDRYDNNGAAPWEREPYLKRQFELFDHYLWPLIDKQRTSKAAGGAGIGVAAGQSAEQALLQAVPKQVMQADQAALGELLREVGGLSAHQLPLTPEAAHTQFNDFMNAVGQAREPSRQGVPQLANEQRLHAFDELVQARELPGSPALRESMEHYGSATYIVDNALDYIAEAAGQGRDKVQSSVSYGLGDNLTGLYKQLYDNVEDLVLTGSADINGTGNALDNAIAGTSGANVLAGGAGNDTLMGAAGSDTYRFNRGDGQDVISDGESFSSSVDVLQFGAGIGANQLWLRKVAAASPLDRYDLEVQVMGTGDKVTIAGWERAGGFAPYDPNANHIEQIRSSDGKTLLDTKVAQLVDAMASMAPPTGATSWSQLTASQQAQLNALGAWG